jgi:hypothetical protein
MKGELNNMFVIEGDLVKIHLVGKFAGRVALTDLKSFLKFELFGYVWRCDKLGYVYTLINNKSLFLHRLITENHDENLQTDHIENTDDPIKDKLDNRRSNLRVATTRENQCNSRLRADSKTGYKGVHFTKGAFNVHAKLNGKKYYFGGYNVKKYGEEKSVIMAALGYDIASEHLNGEFVQHNEIKESGLLTIEEMKIVEEVTYKHIKKHGLLHNETKIEAPMNIYSRVEESIGLEA